MKQQQGHRNKGVRVLLVDRGDRSRELGAVFQALAGVRFAHQSFALAELGDVEDLLVERGGAGTLILEAGLVPSEDIGFVRRFLERQPSWKLVVLGENASDARARGLLALPRAQWLPWPPDLEQLAAVLAGTEAAHAETETAQAMEPAAVRPAPALNGELVDVRSFLEELLAGYALSGAGAPRFLYRCEEPLRLHAPATRLEQGLSGLLGLAHVCAGEAEVVDVVADGLDDRVRVRIDFPIGPLTDADLPGLLDGAFDGPPDLVDAVHGAHASADSLQRDGSQVELLVQRPGRLRIEVLLAERAPNA